MLLKGLKRSILCFVCLIELSTAFYWQLWSFSTMCTEDKGLAFGRSNPWNCNRYLICMSGMTFPGQCPPGLVYSDVTQNCRDPLPSELSRCGRSIIASLEAACTQRPGWKFRSSFSCAQFFECAPKTSATQFLSSQGTSPTSPGISGISGDNSAAGGQGQSQHPLQLMECPYPSLYSMATSSCQSFDKVTCGKRPKPKAPCDYIQYRQLCESPSCQPCSRRHPSCVGLANGAHALSGYDDLYVLCYSERTFDVRKCNQGFVFSSVQKTCVRKAS